MKPVRHPSNTRTLGAPAGWDQSKLPVEALGITDTELEGVPCVMSFWQPDDVELANIAAGGLIGLSIVGRTMPPACVVTLYPEPLAKESQMVVDNSPTWTANPDGSITTASGEPLPMPESGISNAARDVLAERQRQISGEGWSKSHDDCEHGNAPALARAAGCYLLFGDAYPNEGQPPPLWPWDACYWKPKDYRRDGVRAGALILAELERIDRAEARATARGVKLP